MTSQLILPDAGPSADRPAGLSGRILRRLSRVTTSGNFVAEIDGLRFIAIAVVVLFHLLMALQSRNPWMTVEPAHSSVLAAVVRRGFHGVELFFIISGFILAIPFASHYLRGSPAVPLKQYFLRRVTRLEPPYIVSLLLFFVLLIVLKGSSAAALLPHLLASLVYSHNFIYGTESTISIVTWSLEIEIQFYLLVPLLALVFRIADKTLRRAVIGSAIVGLSAFAWLALGPEQPRLCLSIARFLQFFLTGFLLADIFLCDWRGASVRKSFAWDLASVAGWSSLYFMWTLSDISPFFAQRMPGGESFLAAMLFPPIALLCYVAAFRGRVSNSIVANPWIAALGGMCYSIYLLHTALISPAVHIAQKFVIPGFFTTTFILQCVLCLPVVLVPATAYFLLIEKPCMRRDWPQRLLHTINSALPGRARAAATPKRVVE
jgi:peptidoglycan/LPS O-acetylase OafA/YrhL